MASKTTKSNGAAKAKRPSKPPAAHVAANINLDGAVVAERRDPTHDEIASRAFELYQLRGADGGALNDWLAAESELRAS